MREFKCNVKISKFRICIRIYFFMICKMCVVLFYLSVIFPNTKSKHSSAITVQQSNFTLRFLFSADWEHLHQIQ